MGSVHPSRSARQDTVEMSKILFGDGYIDPLTGRPQDGDHQPDQRQFRR